MTYATMCKPGGVHSVRVPADLDAAQSTEARGDGWVPQFDNFAERRLPPAQREIWKIPGGVARPRQLFCVYLVGTNDSVKAVYADDNGGGGLLDFVGPFESCS